MSQDQVVVENQISDAHSPVGMYSLPCGHLTADGELWTDIRLREITGVEEDLLASRSIPGAVKISALITNCAQQVGPVVDKQQIGQIARELTVGDRVYLMFALRRVTLGDQYPFKVKCPSCEEERLYTIDLSELDVKPMKDPKKRVFDVTLPGGKPVRFHVMTGKEEERLSKIKDQTDTLSLSILLRLDLVNGKPADMRTVKGLSLAERNFLRDQFDEAEGGIDTSIDITCSVCGNDFESEVDVGQAGFFFPSQVRKASKTNSSL